MSHDCIMAVFSTLSVSHAMEAVVSTYRKAPVTLSLFASYFVSRLASKLWLDYRLFMALPGGPLPKNVFGWAVHCFVLVPLSLHESFTRSRLVRTYLPRQSAISRTQQQLSTGVALPPRQGPAPWTAGTIPHRQLDQFQQSAKDPATHAAALEAAQQALAHIHATLQEEAEAQPSHLRIGSSQIESHSTALFALSHTLVTASDGVSRSTHSAQFPSSLSRRFLSPLRGEFVHIHGDPQDAASTDGSLHMTLHPDDAGLVVEQGWGELHRLAGFPSYSGFWFGWPAWLMSLRPLRTRSARWWSSTSIPTAEGAKVTKAPGLPPTYCLVYSPRDTQEAQVVQDIIRAAVAFAIGSRPSSR